MVRFEHDRMTLSFATSDTPAPDGVVDADVDVTVTVRVEPVDASNKVEVRFRVNHGLVKVAPARWQRAASGGAHYFLARLGRFQAGDAVEYLPIATCVGRQVPGPEEAGDLAASFRVLAPPRSSQAPGAVRREPVEAAPAMRQAGARRAEQRALVAADALFSELAGDKSRFARNLDDAGRLWFTRRLLAHVRGLAPPPTDVRAKAIELLATAKKLATACVKAQEEEAKTTLAFDLIDLAATAAYGAMGVHPKVLLTEDQTAFIKFVVKRRCRAVDRMRVDVNDSECFVYPANGNLLEQQPSKQARRYWEGVTQVPVQPKRYPFVLSSPDGTGNPASALAHLFDRNEDEEDRSAFDCAAAAMTVHAAALFEAAADPATLGQQLVQEGPRYLAIDHPLGSALLTGGSLDQGVTPIVLEPTGSGSDVDITVAFAWYAPPPPFAALLVDADYEQPVQVKAVGKTEAGYTGKMTVDRLDRSFRAGSRFVFSGHPEFHLTTDLRRDRALFEQTFVTYDDLQVGDHIYITSHPLHRQFLQGASPWGGEHAFVCAAPASRRDQLIISGHGVVPMTLREAVDTKLLVDSNAFLAILRAVLRRQLDGPPPDALQWSGSVDQLANQSAFKAQLRAMYQQPATASVTGTCKVYEFDGVEFRRDDRSETLRSARYQTLTFEGAVGGVTVDAKSFVLYRGLDRPSPPALQDWSTENALIERNDALDPTLPEPARYGIYYFDDVLGRARMFLSLYYTAGDRRCGERHLSYDDVEDIAQSAGMAGHVLVTRPRVPTDPTEHSAYVAALRNKGALPASP